MASTRLIKRRIKSAQNISQITKAMEMVAASKMRRAQEQALLSRPYADHFIDIMEHLASRVSPDIHPLLGLDEDQLQSDASECVVLIAPDKGLCGGLITNLGRQVHKNHDAVFIVAGTRGENLVLKAGAEMIASFELGSAQPNFEFVIPIVRILTEEYLKGSFTRVRTLYTHFESTLEQFPAYRTLLPVFLSGELVREETESEEADQAYRSGYLFEPQPDEVLEKLLPHYVEIELYQVILEAVASEHSARMVAMKSAHDNAEEVVDDLKLVYNRVRQEQITNEINDAVTARMALG